MSSTAKVIRREWLDWPFFEPRHHAVGEALDRFVQSGALDTIDHNDVDGACRKLVRAMGEAGVLDCAVAAPDGDATTIDSRSICLSRESLAYADGLADFAFAMQGLGSGAIALGGSADLRKAVLPKVRAGEWLAAFALSEKEAGSDVAAMSCTARADGNDYVIDGEKTWISNGGIADVYTLFARTGEAPGARGISAFVVFPDDPGFGIADRIDVIAPHPLATLRFTNCRIPASRRLGAPGGGFKLAMQTLDIFRASVAAAALGFAPARTGRSAVACAQPAHVRCDAGRSPADPGRARRHGDGDRRRRAADLPRGLASRRPEASDDARSCNGEADGNRDRAARHRPRRPDVRRPRRAQG